MLERKWTLKPIKKVGFPPKKRSSLDFLQDEILQRIRRKKTYLSIRNAKNKKRKLNSKNCSGSESKKRKGQRRARRKNLSSKRSGSFLQLRK